jgi:cysteinyl-tRNA synthetase
LLRVPAEEWFKRPPTRSFAATEALRELPDAGALLTLDEDRIEALIDARRAARAAGDFKTSDRIRTELREAGIELEDQPGGRTRWKRA